MNNETKNIKRSAVQRMYDNIQDMKQEEKAELIEKLLDAQLTSVEEDNLSSEILKLDDISEELIDRIDNTGKPVGLSSGYRVIDDMTMGFAPGELTIVAAKTSVGKSLLCMNIAANMMYQSHKVGFITLEMLPSELGARLWNIAGADLFMNKIMPNLFVNKNTHMNYHSVEGFVKKCVNNGAEIVFIDHLHYFSRSLDNSATELGIITQEFKQIALKYKIPIVLISHTRKVGSDGYDREATINDLRGSSFIAQDADIVLMLNNVMTTIGENKVIDSTKIKITLEKNRNRFCVPVGSSFELEKDGLVIKPQRAEDLGKWNMNKPQSLDKGFSAKHSNNTVSEPKTVSTPQKMPNTGISTAPLPPNVSSGFDDLI